jgi:plastocyanin
MKHHLIQTGNHPCSTIIRLIVRIVLFFALMMLCVSWLAPLPARAYDTYDALKAQGDVAFVDILGSGQPPGFAPALLTVHVYDTIVFLNQSQPAVSYAVVADDGSFSSPVIAPGQQWSLTVNSPGAFEYHEAGTTPRMVGAIVVVDAAIPLLPTPVPAAQATAMSDINAGHRPPDTVWQQELPQPSSHSGKVSGRGTSSASKASPWMFWVSFASTAALVIAVEVGIFGLVRGGMWGARWARAHWKRSDVDEDEDLDMEEEEEEKGA